MYVIVVRLIWVYWPVTWILCDLCYLSTFLQIVAMRRDAQSKEQQIQYKDQQIQDKDQQIQDKDQQIRDKDQQVRDKDQDLQHVQQQVHVYF